MFGVAAKLESAIRSDREYKTLRRELKQKGLTDYQIDMIRNSVPRKLFNTDGTWVNKYCLGDNHRPHEDYEHEIEAIKNLRKRGYIWTDRHQEYWFLTKSGIQTRNDLEYHNPTSETIPVVYGGSQNNNVTVHPSTVDTQTDISLARDGLMTTCSKLWWVWNNKEAIEDKRRKEFLEEFQKGQEAIDEAMQMIATAEQRVARKLIEQGPPPAPKSTWTEDQQRAQNDLYWMGGGVAFWLNPMGLLADPTPAPEWWSPPLDYKSLTARHLEARKEDDVVALSLMGPKGDQGPPGASKPEWLCLNKNGGIVYGMRTQAEVDRFIGARKHRGEGFTVARTDSTAYAELYAAYVTQGEMVPALPEDIADKYDEKTREAMLDELIAELDSMGDKTEDYDDWVDHYEFKTGKKTKIRTGNTRHGVITQAKAQKDGNFFMVEFNNVVRGFESQLEAETWLGEQRTAAIFARNAQVDAELKMQEAKLRADVDRLTAEKIKGDKIASKIDIYAPPRRPRPSKVMK